MIHTASLVHDDVIDESDQRRGRPTVSSLSGNKAVSVHNRNTVPTCLNFEPAIFSGNFGRRLYFGQSHPIINYRRKSGSYNSARSG